MCLISGNAVANFGMKLDSNNSGSDYECWEWRDSSTGNSEGRYSNGTMFLSVTLCWLVNSSSIGDSFDSLQLFFFFSQIFLISFSTIA